MKSILRMILLFMISLVAHSRGYAQSFEQSSGSSSSEATYCEACGTNNTPLRQSASQARNIRNAVSTGAEAQIIARIANELKWSDGCRSFYLGDKYGKWGRIIYNTLKQGTNQYRELLRGSSDIRQFCPGYDNMDEEGRLGLWVLIFAGMANYESSCRANPPSIAGPNGTLAGILQLHLSKEPSYNEDCARSSALSPQGSFLCGMAMLNEQLAKEERLFSNNSYWEVFTPKSPRKLHLKMQQVIKRYDLCH